MSHDFVDQPTLDLTNEVIITSPMPVFMGSYSVVFKGHYKGRMVAVKRLQIVFDNSMNSMQRKVHRERRVWGRLDHPNIVPMYGFAEGEELFGPLGALISPWYSNGDADKYLQIHGSSMSLGDRKALWQGVVSGVCYLHSNNPVIIHGDLKPGNILIDDAGSPRICDFGLVHIFLEEGHSGLTTTSLHTGTERYLAPELLRDEDRPTKANDVWALGCIGLEFLFSQIPYSHHNNNRTGRMTADMLSGVPPAIRPPVLSQEDAELWTLFESCWRREVAVRATASQIFGALQRYGQPLPPNPHHNPVTTIASHKRKSKRDKLMIPTNPFLAPPPPPTTSGGPVRPRSRAPLPHRHAPYTRPTTRAASRLSVAQSQLSTSGVLDKTPSNPAPPPLTTTGPADGKSTPFSNVSAAISHPYVTGVHSSAVHKAHEPNGQSWSGLTQGGIEWNSDSDSDPKSGEMGTGEGGGGGGGSSESNTNGSGDELELDNGGGGGEVEFDTGGGGGDVEFDIGGGGGSDGGGWGGDTQMEDTRMEDTRLEEARLNRTVSR